MKNFFLLEARQERFDELRLMQLAKLRKLFQNSLTNLDIQ